MESIQSTPHEIHPSPSQQATPTQPTGPFYPTPDTPIPTADLVAASPESPLATGQIIWVEGTVRDHSGRPVAGALVEIWQACHTGRYNHPEDTNTAELDPNFQYWGRAITTPQGRYRFRTVVPGVYPAEEDWHRPPHIHFKISHPNFEPLITQMYFAGDPLNEIDQILQKLDGKSQKELIVQLKQNEDELWPVAVFDIRI